MSSSKIDLSTVSIHDRDRAATETLNSASRMRPLTIAVIVLGVVTTINTAAVLAGGGYAVYTQFFVRPMNDNDRTNTNNVPKINSTEHKCPSLRSDEMEDSAVENRTALLECEVSLLKSRIAQLQNKDTAVENRTALLESEVSIVRSQIAQLQNKDTAVANQTALLESEVSLVKNQIAQLQNKGTAVANQTALLESEVSFVKSQIAQLQNEGNSLESQIVQLRRQDSAVENRTALLESEVSLVKSQIAQLQNKAPNCSTTAKKSSGKRIQSHPISITLLVCFVFLCCTHRENPGSPT